MDFESKTTASGRPPERLSGPTPTVRTLPDGQHADHWVLSPEERAKGFVRPVRLVYKHAGTAGPKYPLRDLTPAEAECYAGEGYVKYEAYPEEARPLAGVYWTADELAAIGKGCGAETRMPESIAETYAREPNFYGSTFCVGCKTYRPVGARGEFVWLDGSRVGA